MDNLDKRIMLAHEKHPELFVDEIVPSRSLHDAWCNILNGRDSDGCNCDPDVIFYVQGKEYSLDAEGNCKHLAVDRN